MTNDEAIELVRSMRARGIELRQRGRLLNIERGAEKVGGPLREIISTHWHQVARAVSALRQCDRAIEGARRRRVNVACTNRQRNVHA